MPLTEQVFCDMPDSVYHGSINIRNVTAHIFIKENVKTGATFAQAGTVYYNAAVAEKIKKRGRPRKNAN